MRSVMMGWEEPLMKEHVRLMCEERSRGGGGESSTTDDDGAEKGLSILNVGFGLGIVRFSVFPSSPLSPSISCPILTPPPPPPTPPQIDRIFQSLPTKPTNHIIIEAHPQVLSYIRSTGFDKLPGVKVLPGRWQDWLTPDRIGEVLSMTAPPPTTGKGKQVDQDEGKAAAAENDDDGEEQVDWEAMGSGFDAIFVDTFAEGYEGAARRSMTPHPAFQDKKKKLLPPPHRPQIVL
jgi:protein arginine N-methyltransferase 2